jgi:hypothetical protein
METIDRPYVEKLELLKNLGARRAQIHEQRISPLIDEFENEVTENVVLQQLSTTRLFLKFIEYFNDFVDTSEETITQLVDIIVKMVKLNQEGFVPKEAYLDLQDQLEDMKYGRALDVERDAQTAGRTDADIAERAQFTEKVKAIVSSESRAGKSVGKMKALFRKRLNIAYQWQADIIETVVNKHVMDTKMEKIPFTSERQQINKQKLGEKGLYDQSQSSDEESSEESESEGESDENTEEDEN